jgi:hypothetical protein
LNTLLSLELTGIATSGRLNFNLNFWTICHCNGADPTQIRVENQFPGTTLTHPLPSRRDACVSTLPGITAKKKTGYSGELSPILAR